MVEARTWWRRPELRDDQRRSVGWLELFFDLVFVVVIARLAHYLAGDLTPRTVLEFVIQFAGVFWIWNAFTYYTERFESGGLEDRFFTFLALLPVAGLAVFANGGLAEHHDEFALAYLGARLVNMIGWVRASLNVPTFRSVSRPFYAGFGVVAVLLLISMESGRDERLWLWAIAVLIDVLTPAFTMRQQAKLPPIGIDRFPERFGLFTLLVLGATVVGVIGSLSDLSDTMGIGGATWANAPFGLAIGFGLWWLYFDFVARRPPKQQVTTVLTWVHLHFVTVMMIAVTGAGISVAILDDAGGSLQTASQRMVATGVGGALIAVALLETTLLRLRDEPTHPLMSPFLKIATGGVALLAGWASEQWSTPSLFLLLLMMLLIPCAYGALAWYARPAPATGEAEVGSESRSRESGSGTAGDEEAGPPVIDLTDDSHVELPDDRPPVIEPVIDLTDDSHVGLPDDSPPVLAPDAADRAPDDEPGPDAERVRSQEEPAPVPDRSLPDDSPTSDEANVPSDEDGGSSDEKLVPSDDATSPVDGPADDDAAAAAGQASVSTAERTALKVESPPPDAPKPRRSRARRK